MIVPSARLDFPPGDPSPKPLITPAHPREGASGKVAPRDDVGPEESALPCGCDAQEDGRATSADRETGGDSCGQSGGKGGNRTEAGVVVDPRQPSHLSAAHALRRIQECPENGQVAWDGEHLVKGSAKRSRSGSHGWLV